MALLCLWWRPQCNFTWNLIHHPFLFNNQPLILGHPSVNISLQIESSVPFSPRMLSRFSRVWLCDPMDCSPPGFSVHGILQSRILEWVAIYFSNAWKWKVKVKLISCIWLCATPWTAALQASLSMGFSRQEYWSGMPLPSPFYSLLLPFWGDF